MLYLITGLPGAGKTLHAVSLVPTFDAFKGREVYYSGIKDLRLPWHEMASPEDWVNCPDGAVIVIDEAQRCMRVRAPGAKVPEHVQQLETHRHRGLDLVLITQHPNLLDTNVRRLIGWHRNVRRTFGMASAKLFTWDRVGDPDSNADIEQAEATRWQYDKAAFAKYQSAEVHTHKVRLPKRIAFAAFLLVLLVSLIWYTVAWMKKRTEPKKEPVAAVGVQALKTDARKGPPVTYQDWTDERKPVAPEDVSSAPRYFALTQPTRAPRLAGCIRSASKCQCYTQQGTILNVGEQQCAEVLATLHFQDWGPGGESGWKNDELQNMEQQPTPGADGRSPAAPVGPAAPRPAPPVVVPQRP